MKRFSLVIFLFLTFLLRFPSFFEPYWYGDEGVTLTVGQAISRGGVLYRDIDDNKPPLLYFLSATVSGDLFSFKILTFFWTLFTVSFFYFLANSFLGKKWAFFSALIFVLLVNTPVLEGNIINGEIYFILPTILAAFLIWKYQAMKNISRANVLLFLGGIISSFGFLFKVPAIADFGSLLFFLALSASGNSSIFRKIFPFLAGFAVPVILTVIYFIFGHALSDFIRSVFLNNFIYAQIWEIKFISQKQYLYLKALILFGVMVLLFLRRRKTGKDSLFVSLWFFFSLFGALLSARPYSHYLLQVAPSFSLLIGLFLKKKHPGFAIPLIFLLGAVWYQFGLSKGYFDYSYWYYKNFLAFLRQEKTYAWYAQTFDPQVSQTYALGDFLKKNTRVWEKIFVWSDNSLIYALSRRPPAGRFVTAYYIQDLPYGQKETLEKLSLEKPKFIIVTFPKREFAQLDKVIAEEYNLYCELKGAKIYERKKRSPGEIPL